MPTVTVTWKATKDDRTCPICRAIDGYIWTFENEVPDSLVHPQFGEVWNTQIGSLAHEHQFSTPKKGGGVSRSMKYGLLSKCRCHVEPKITSLKDVADAVHKLLLDLKGETPEPNDTETGQKRSTTFEDLGIDPSKYGLE